MKYPVNKTLGGGKVVGRRRAALFLYTVANSGKNGTGSGEIDFIAPGYLPDESNAGAFGLAAQIAVLRKAPCVGRGGLEIRNVRAHFEKKGPRPLSRKKKLLKRDENAKQVGEISASAARIRPPALFFASSD